MTTGLNDYQPEPSGSCCSGCLGGVHGDSPLCPHSREGERGDAPRPCVGGDALLVEAVRQLRRRNGLRQLWSGRLVDRKVHDLEWYDTPGFELQSAHLELALVQALLAELHFRDLEQYDLSA